MKKYLIIFISILCLSIIPSIQARADEDDSDAFTARISAEADYKIRKGLHVYASEEIRLGGTNIMDRSHTEIGISYKINPYLKTAVSYTAIAAYKSEISELENNMELVRYWYDWRHRISADITGSFKAGQWRFSLRERIQGTYKTRELNNYQQPQMGWVLRSRLKASYKFRSVPLEPYAFFEPRLLLNGAKWSEESTTALYDEATFVGHKDIYINRLRGAIGLEWKLNKRHSLDIYCLYDYLRDKEVDATKEDSKKGNYLKSPIIMKTGTRVSLGIGYSFSF